MKIETCMNTCGNDAGKNEVGKEVRPGTQAGTPHHNILPPPAGWSGARPTLLDARFYDTLKKLTNLHVYMGATPYAAASPLTRAGCTQEGVAERLGLPAGTGWEELATVALLRLQDAEQEVLERDGAIKALRQRLDESMQRAAMLADLVGELGRKR